jgi:hypothetical protein
MNIKKNFIVIILFFFAGLYILAGSNSVYSFSSLIQRSDNLSYTEKKEDVVKPFSKIKKIKLKVRCKSSEIKFNLATFSFYPKKLFLYERKKLLGYITSLASGFHFLVQLRGPPIVLFLV